MTFCIARQDTKTTKETILEASFKLFLAKGYRGISMPDIERATMITRPYSITSSIRRIYLSSRRTISSFLFLKRSTMEKNT